MKYQGSCHCGRVKFEAEGEIASALACNCSMCRRRGSLLWFLPPGAINMLTPEDDAATYLFNKHVIKHRFCSTCGIHTYGEGKSPKGDAVVAVNIRCLEDVDLQAIPVSHYDGRAI